MVNSKLVHSFYFCTLFVSVYWLYNRHILCTCCSILFCTRRYHIAIPYVPWYRADNEQSWLGIVDTSSDAAAKQSPIKIFHVQFLYVLDFWLQKSLMSLFNAFCCTSLLTSIFKYNPQCEYQWRYINCKEKNRSKIIISNFNCTRSCSSHLFRCEPKIEKKYVYNRVK